MASTKMETVSDRDDAAAQAHLLGDKQQEQRQQNRVPRAAAFIMGTEFCERYSFYGLKAILAIYLTHFLKFDQNNATFTIHFFVFMCYTCPLLGAFLADSYWGRYRTIINLSLVYCLGNLVVSITAIPGVTGTPPHWWGVVTGLVLIALGTGGIKPCVSSFVGDQFRPGQERLLSNIFAAFYFVINVGSLASVFITPLLREYVSYPVAFGVPAALLFVATLIFWMGRSSYRHIPPGGDSVLSTFFGVISFSLAEQRRCRSAGVRSLPHWLDYALVVYPKDMVDDVKRVLSVLKVFLPLPIFWALFDQHASRWIFQAEQLDRRIGTGQLLPDQIPSLNPMLLIMMIPIFDRAIYPLLRRLGFALRPLHRMASGMTLSAISFISAAVLQVVVDANPDGTITVWWQLPQYILMCGGEILVSITGLEFTYSQAPRSMKSVVMSCYLFTTAIGNLIIAVIAELRFHARAAEFFFFSGFMLLALILFLLIIRNYRYKVLRASTSRHALHRPPLDAEDGSTSDSSGEPLFVSRTA